MVFTSIYGSIMEDQHEFIPDGPRKGVDGAFGRLGKFYSLVFGQIISVLVAGTGACTTLFQKYSHMDAPSAQNAPNYVLLSLFLVAPLRRIMIEKNNSFRVQSPVEQEKVVIVQSGEETTLQDDLNQQPVRLGRQDTTPIKDNDAEDHWWRYAIVALVDVEANVTVVWAYQYTSITSAMLLDCFTIPSVMVLSYFFLHARYSAWHIIGAFLCLCGICLIILSDVLEGTDSSAHPRAWVGDILCIVSSFLYSVSNVIQEKWVRAAGPPRFLGRLGIFGAFISISQAAIFERKALFQGTKWNEAGFGAWAGYTASLNLAYILTSWFLVDADAAFFNLSLLTSDVYAVVFSYFFNGTSVPPLYFLAFAFTLSGLFIYHRTTPPTTSKKSSDHLSLPQTQYTGLVDTTQNTEIEEEKDMSSLIRTYGESGEDIRSLPDELPSTTE